MLYNVIKSLITRGQTEGLAKMINVLYAVDGLTYEQYKELIEQMGDSVVLDSSQISYSFPEQQNGDGL